MALEVIMTSLLGLITASLIPMNIKIQKIQTEIKSNKTDDNNFRRDMYKEHIIEFHNRIIFHSDKKYPQHMYRKTFDYYDKYTALGGNSYVSEVIGDVRAHYNKYYGGKQ